MGVITQIRQVYLVSCLSLHLVNEENKKEVQDLSKDSFVFYSSYIEAIEIFPISDGEKFEVIKAISDYTTKGIEPKFENKVLIGIFILIKPQIDANNKKYNKAIENGRLGGRPAKNKQNKENLNLKEEKILEKISPPPQNHENYENIDEIIDSEIIIDENADEIVENIELKEEVVLVENNTVKSEEVDKTIPEEESLEIEPTNDEIKEFLAPVTKEEIEKLVIQTISTNRLYNKLFNGLGDYYLQEVAIYITEKYFEYWSNENWVDKHGTPINSHNWKTKLANWIATTYQNKDNEMSDFPARDRVRDNAILEEKNDRNRIYSRDKKRIFEERRRYDGIDLIWEYDENSPVDGLQEAFCKVRELSNNKLEFYEFYKTLSKEQLNNYIKEYRPTEWDGWSKYKDTQEHKEFVRYVNGESWEEIKASRPPVVLSEEEKQRARDDHERWRLQLKKNARVPFKPEEKKRWLELNPEASENDLPKAVKAEEEKSVLGEIVAKYSIESDPSRLKDALRNSYEIVKQKSDLEEDEEVIYTQNNNFSSIGDILKNNKLIRLDEFKKSDSLERKVGG